MVISYLQTNSSAPVTNQFNEGVGYISFVPPPLPRHSARGTSRHLYWTRLARHLGGSPMVWLTLQADLDLAEAERTHGKTIRSGVMPAA